MNDPTLLFYASYLDASKVHPDSQSHRRRVKAIAANSIWTLPSTELLRARLESARSLSLDSAPWIGMLDPYDFPDDGEGLVTLKGLVVRTDYSDDSAWKTFLEALKNVENEGFEALVMPPEVNEGDEAMENTEDESSSDSEDEDMDTSVMTLNRPSVFRIIQAKSAEERQILENAANFRLLRLFSDLEVIQAPQEPRTKPGEYFGIKPKRPPLSPNNPLVEKFGYKEIYKGRTIWVWDSESKGAGSVRLIDRGSDSSFGSSTGDSWRARVSHMWELQVRLDSGSMKIGFSGNDMWTSSERTRNYEELQRELIGAHQESD